MSDDNFLARWSRRKVEARKGEPSPDVPPVPAVSPAQAGAQLPAPAVSSKPEPLPALESLTPHSDFSPFMREGVDPAVKGEALKKLFSDPALYPMDGLDVYIDDYSKPDPLPEGWLEQLNQFAAMDSHNQPERDAEARKAPAIPASTPPTESAASPPPLVSGPQSSGSQPETSAQPPATPDAAAKDAG